MSESHALVTAYYDALNRADWATWERCVAADFQHHTPHMPPGRESFQQLLRLYRAGFPDFRHEVLEIVGDGPRVAVHTRSQGTHRGDFLGHPPTGATFSAEAVDILTIEGGRVVARQGIFDTLTMLQQLGLYQPVQHDRGQS